MVTIVGRTVIGTDVVYDFVGKSTDEKPVSTNGSQFLEMDTGKEYFFDGDEQGWSEQDDKYLDSIAIETAPTKTAYYEGSDFDATGMSIKAFYTDESNAIVEKFEVVAPSPLKVGDEVKAKYIENGRTRYAIVDVEIKTNVVKDAEAFAEVLANGNAVVLDADIEVNLAQTFTRDFIFDLNGHSIVDNKTTTKKVDYLFFADGCTLTLKGEGEIVATKAKMRVAEAMNGGTIVIESGKYTSTKELGFDAIGVGSKVIFNGGEINAVEGGIMAFDGASMEINGGKIVVSDNFPIGTNGSENRGNNTIVMNGGYLEGHITSNGYEAIGIYIANNDTFTMNDGEIFVENGAGILMRGGTVTLNGGKIKTTGIEGGGGWIGDNKTVMSQSAIIYDEKSNYPGKVGMNLTVNGGTYVGFDKSIDVQSTEVEPQVFVNGGAFVPPYVPVDA